MSPRYGAPSTSACSMCARAIPGDAVRGCEVERTREKGKGKGNEAEISSHRASVNGYPRPSRAAIFGTLIERINRETSPPPKPSFEHVRRFFAGASPFLDDSWKIHCTIAFRDINIARRYKIRK